MFVLSSKGGGGVGRARPTLPPFSPPPPQPPISFFFAVGLPCAPRSFVYFCVFKRPSPLKSQNVAPFHAKSLLAASVNDMYVRALPTPSLAVTTAMTRAAMAVFLAPPMAPMLRSSTKAHGSSVVAKLLAFLFFGGSGRGRG